MNYYRLVKSKSTFVKDNILSLGEISDLHKLEPIRNDLEFNNAAASEGYFLLSGGGTYLINERFLVVVERSSTSSINPGKISIFTGRSDSINEILNPRLLCRELFEELLIYDSLGNILYPESDQYQDIIDSVYHSMLKDNYIDRKFSKIKLPLKTVNSTKTICVGNTCLNLDFYVNSIRDINVLFLFNLKLKNLNDVFFKDGEYHRCNERNLSQNRTIMLFDIENHMLCEQDGCPVRKIDLDNTSEHLAYLIRNFNHCSFL